MSSRAEELKIFSKYVPEAAKEWCHALWKQYKFSFTITQPRLSKFGDYSYQMGNHKITVNGNLNPYAFLVTYLHEIAHLITRNKYQNRVLPHGREWKAAFSLLLKEALQRKCFTKELEGAIQQHLKNPTASSAGDVDFFKALSNEDDETGEQLLMESIPDGTVFVFNQSIFKRVGLLKSRIEAIELATGRRFRFSPIAKISLFEGDVQAIPNHKPHKTVADVLRNESFNWRGEKYKKLESKRTRAVCLHLKSKRQYLIPLELEIDKAES